MRWGTSRTASSWVRCTRVRWGTPCRAGRVRVGEFMFATGIECSYPTIEGGRWRMDQLEATGHYRYWRRDLELVRELGLRYLRYGPPFHRILLGPRRYDWTFMDQVAEAMQ